MVAEKIRTLIADHSFDGIEHVTLSVGITQYREGDDIEQILHRVDINLYHAKQQGRNQTIADQD
ncbi:diguanylate cyclase [Candidatus Reidiella endopervernicosa]|uniref:diguanylate cyclase n=1 Tax=Candidatus Reidiella endopervernicosa TaxID=2738883 RepID=A0A6N0I0H0_9GAMM|nr:diguanylate cyclase [Candidatus Reidiella endopervernicosa]